MKQDDETTLALDRELDQGRGECWLRRIDIASVVQDALLHFDGHRYRLLAWCIMPNHVHVVVEALHGHSLSSVYKAGSRLQADVPTKYSAVPALSGIPITSIAIGWTGCRSLGVDLELGLF